VLFYNNCLVKAAEGSQILNTNEFLERPVNDSLVSYVALV